MALTAGFRSRKKNKVPTGLDYKPKEPEPPKRDIFKEVLSTYDKSDREKR